MKRLVYLLSLSLTSMMIFSCGSQVSPTYTNNTPVYTPVSTSTFDPVNSASTSTNKNCNCNNKTTAYSEKEWSETVPGRPVLTNTVTKTTTVKKETTPKVDPNLPVLKSPDSNPVGTSPTTPNNGTEEKDSIFKKIKEKLYPKNWKFF